MKYKNSYNKLKIMCENRLEKPFDWRDHWRDMPEFVQIDLTSARVLRVHFRSESDAQVFAAAIGQRITAKQKSLWFPEMPKRRKAHLRYLEADDVSG